MSAFVTGAPGTQAPWLSIRHRIVALLAVFSLTAYVLRMNISVAAKFMIPELGLTQIQMGQVFSAFMLGYAIFQIPWGLLGDRASPRMVLTVATLTWAITTALTGLLPGLIPGALASFLGLLVLRFVLGASQAALYPLAARVLANWMPATERAFGYSLIIAAAAAGSAFTGPLVAWCMVTLGWRISFYVCAALAVAIAGLWFWYATDSPKTHPGITEAELALTNFSHPLQSASALAPSSNWWKLLSNRNIALICASYFLSSYLLFMFVFWFYLYLVDERKFSALSGGLYTSLPYITALLVVPAAGYLCDRLSAGRGKPMGRRIVAIAGFAISGIALLAGTRMVEPYSAIAALSISVAFLMSTEGPFWSSIIDIAGEHSGAAGGIMNMAGNLGGVVSTIMIPVLVKQFGWATALGSGSALALVSGAIWFLINAEPAGATTHENAEFAAAMKKQI